MDTAFVTLFPTTYEAASCQLHTLLCTGWLHATLINIYRSVLVVTILPVFCGSERLGDNYIVTRHPGPSTPSPINRKSYVGVTPQQSTSRVIFRIQELCQRERGPWPLSCMVPRVSVGIKQHSLKKGTLYPVLNITRLADCWGVTPTELSVFTRWQKFATFPEDPQKQARLLPPELNDRSLIKVAGRQPVQSNVSSLQLAIS